MLTSNNKSLLFSFAHMTKNKRYSLAHMEKFRGNAAPILESLFALFEDLSLTSLESIERLDKFHGGYECIPTKEMKAVITDNLAPEQIPAQLIVFRFGHEKDRLVCAQFNENPRILYVLGFDLDHSLYNHGA